MSGILATVSGLGSTLKLKGQGVVDSIFPPEKRAEALAKLQGFAIENPKLSVNTRISTLNPLRLTDQQAFLLANIVLTGFPLLMFGVFTLTVFVFSLVAALLVAVLVALLFTVFMVGVALLFILPTVLLTTFAASFIFLWGLGGYYILKWFNEGESPAPEGSAIGDSLNSLTGGRLGFIMDGARKKESTGNVENNGANAKNSTPGGVDDVKKNVSTATKNVNVDGVKKRASGATGTATGAVGSAKGALSGVTGL